VCGEHVVMGDVCVVADEVWMLVSERAKCDSATWDEHCGDCCFNLIMTARVVLRRLIPKSEGGSVTNK